MTEKLSVREFFQRFPDDAACLEHVMEVRYGLRHECAACNKGKAGEDRKAWTFHRLADRKAYSCANCGYHIYPCAGTIFQDSRTSLQLWFYAIFLFVTTRHGVSGMELHRALGVTKKTGWRMGHQIRKLMFKADGIERCRGTLRWMRLTLEGAERVANEAAAHRAKPLSLASRSVAAGCMLRWFRM